MHISVAGNIGAGKTSLTKLLAKHYNWEANYEDADTNPYLDDFYEDMLRWSFNLQIYFLFTRFKKIQQIHKSGKNIIQDRTIYEDAHIFAPNLHAMNLLSTRDHETYQRLYDFINSFIDPPNLLIYLRASVPTLVNQIQNRGRNYENTIRLDYLKRLNERYEAWIANYEYKHIIIDVDSNDFINNNEDLGKIINQIDAELFGLF